MKTRIYIGSAVLNETRTHADGLFLNETRLPQIKEDPR